jgi:hypothetical protein
MRNYFVLLTRDSSGDKLRRMRWMGHVVRMGEKNAYRVLMRTPERNKPLPRPKYMGRYIYLHLT